MALADAAAETTSANLTPLAFAMIGAAAVSAVLLPIALAIPATIVLGTLGLALLQRRAMGRWPTVPEAGLDALLLAAFALARDDTLRVWQTPDVFSQVLRLTGVGEALMVAVFGLAAAALLMRARRHILLPEVLGIVLVPILFNLLLLVGSDVLVNRLGFWMTAEAAVDDRWRGVLGRSAVLIVVVEALIIALRGLVAHRLPRDSRMHLLLIGTAIHAALTPVIADITQHTAALGGAVQFVLGVATAAVAQSGLWALTFVITGLAIDALSHRPPTYTVAYRHWIGEIGRAHV